jgi:D-alanyl-D-alanine dipeptidase
MPKKLKILTYREVALISSGENREPLVDVRTYDSTIISQYTEGEKKEMFPFTGDRIFVRDTVARKIAKINRKLARYGKFRLNIVAGYRHPTVQKKYFEKKRAQLKAIYPNLTNEELDSLTHNFVAVPSVAGHPTGGAIDVTIVNSKGNEIDMGTQIADFRNPKKMKTFAKGLTNKQKKNRLLLHDILVREEFAPFYGEWWHFSYGDQEWACFYNRAKSIYSQIKFKKHKNKKSSSLC